MKLPRTVSFAAAAAVCSAAAVPAALAGGEPKNRAPFTRPAANASTTYLASGQTSALHPLTRVLRWKPEAKNGLPFTRRVAPAAQASGLRTVLGCSSASAASATTAHAPANVSHSSRALQMVELGDGAARTLPIRAHCGGTRTPAAEAANRFQVLRDAV